MSSGENPTGGGGNSVSYFQEDTHFLISLKKFFPQTWLDEIFKTHHSEFTLEKLHKWLRLKHVRNKHTPENITEIYDVITELNDNCHTVHSLCTVLDIEETHTNKNRISNMLKNLARMGILGIERVDYTEFPKNYCHNNAFKFFYVKGIHTQEDKDKLVQYYIQYELPVRKTPLEIEEPAEIEEVEESQEDPVLSGKYNYDDW
jgi:hypothetical protein